MPISARSFACNVRINQPASSTYWICCHRTFTHMQQSHHFRLVVELMKVYSAISALASHQRFDALRAKLLDAEMACAHNVTTRASQQLLVTHLTNGFLPQLIHNFFLRSSSTTTTHILIAMRTLSLQRN
jgi:hypothetical protein